MNARVVSCVVLAASLVSGSALALTVDEAVTAGCSTSQLAGLNAQIIAQGNCIVPGAYVELPARPNANFGSAVLPFLEEPARDALQQALDDNPGVNVSINSMLRTVAQQYLLYRWDQLNTCGIGLAASPGNSNHETGLAIDLSEYNTWRPILSGYGFQWFGSGDPVHFDYSGPGAIDHRGVDVMAFQQLWNINNPGDLIDDDGSYGPQTEARLVQSPAEGFPIGANCGDPVDALTISASFVDADDSFDDGPSLDVTDLFVDNRYRLDVEVRNDGTTDSGALTLLVELPEGVVADDDSTSVSVALDSIAAGQSGNTSVELLATMYTVDQLAPSPIELTLAGTSATVNVDVYSQRRWEWDGSRLEGWTAASGELSVDDDLGALVHEGGSGELSVIGPTLTLELSGSERITLGMVRSGGAGPAWLYFTTVQEPQRSEAQRFELLVVANGELHDLVIDTTQAAGFTGTLTSLELQAFDSDSDGAGHAELTYLRIEQGTPVGETPLAEDTGCACTSAGGHGQDAAWPLSLLLAALLLRRRD
jgi:MYXO-CTERM domain-containing protein